MQKENYLRSPKSLLPVAQLARFGRKRFVVAEETLPVAVAAALTIGNIVVQVDNLKFEADFEWPWVADSVQLNRKDLLNRVLAPWVQVWLGSVVAPGEHWDADLY